MAIVDFQQHGEAARANLLEQFKDQAHILAILGAVAAQNNELDAVLVDLVTERTVDSAAGAQLRRLAELVNIEPGGSSDDELRARIKAEVRLNRGSGTTEDILEVLSLVVGAEKAITLATYYPAAILVTVLDTQIADVIADLVARARSGGVRAQLVYSEGDPDETFTFASGDEPEASEAQGFADDAQTTGGLWADVLEA
jgi:hypothetical protein